jgi:hypothetical protein
MFSVVNKGEGFTTEFAEHTEKNDSIMPNYL